MNQLLHKQILSKCLELLAANDVAVKPATQAIIDHFFSTDEHLSLEDFEYFSTQRNLNASLSEIRTALQLLVDYGFASRKVFGDGVERYEHQHVGAHHDHLYCIKCSAIIEFYSEPLEEEQLAIAKEHSFHAFSHKMQINGICDVCFRGINTGLIPLSLVEAGGRFKIRRLEHSTSPGHGREFLRRLQEMGIRQGLEGEILQRSPGIIMVILGNTRVALRRGQSQRILVELLN
ncbi:MAG: hypothetical protein GF398_08105 [Chitinivibrionales bacterium]|nr:hypothetical protein [Chitinivibrionales bacterium]